MDDSSVLKALSVLLFLETAVRVHFISFRPQVSCSTEACRGSTVLSKDCFSAVTFDFFKANLRIISSYSILPHGTGETQHIQTGLLLDENKLADVLQECT